MWDMPGNVQQARLSCLHCQNPVPDFESRCPGFIFKADMADVRHPERCQTSTPSTSLALVAWQPTSPQYRPNTGLKKNYQGPLGVSPGEPPHKQMHPFPHSFLDLPAPMPLLDAARVTNVSGKKIFICSRSSKGTLAGVRQERRSLPPTTNAISAIKRKILKKSAAGELNPRPVLPTTTYCQGDHQP